jgi:hypothetical protein
MNKKVLLVSIALFLISFSLIVFELLLTRLFSIVLFAQFAHLALALALLGIGVGATAQHLWPRLMPEEGIERRLGWVILLQAVFTVVAVLCALYFPIVTQFETPPETLGERSVVRDKLMNSGWFIALLPMLTLPFAAAGLAFSGVFQRMRSHIGTLYGADLIGGALGAAVFIPVLGILSGPDTLLFIVTTLALASLILFALSKSNIGLAVAGILAVAGLTLTIIGASGVEIIKIRNAAGYSEKNVIYSQWTALSRLSIHKGKRRGDLMLLDNTSASEIPKSRADVKRLAKEINRSLVYDLFKPDARVAVLAASAGPEVSIAEAAGFRNIDAIDIAGEIFDIVKKRYADVDVNPYTQEGVRTIKSDGRAAILHADKPYDIIHMVHANLWSSAGLLSSAWSPSLLETVEAFETYLDKLTPNGMISFGRGSMTGHILHAAAKALEKRGVKEPWRHIAYIRGSAMVLLVKKNPWTKKERDRLLKTLRLPKYKAKLVMDPTVKPKTAYMSDNVMTDDRPYLDDKNMLGATLSSAMKFASGKSEQPLAALYRSVVLQSIFVIAAGLLFVFLPMLRRGPTELKGIKNLSFGLLYVSCLGYAYLAVETVLIHELVLFVGHPTYAVTVVIFSMLLFSGIGSILVGRIKEASLLKVLRIALAAILVLGALHAWVIPDLLHKFALGLPIAVRISLTGLVLAPIGLLMGMPFPLAMRLLPESASGMIPWAWALNGWMSVVAGLLTVLLSRIWGYSLAFTVALGAYALAALLCNMIPRIRPKAVPAAVPSVDQEVSVDTIS